MKKITLMCMLLLNISLYSQQRYTSPTTLYEKGDCYQCYDEGGLIVVATAKIRSAPSGLGHEFRVKMVVVNQSENTIEVNTDDFKAYTLKGKKNQVKELKVFSDKDYEKWAYNNIIWFGPNNSRSVSATTTIKDQYGNRIGKVEASSRVYTGELSELLSDTEISIKNNYLSRNTLFSGDMQIGFFMIDSIKKGSVYLDVNLGGNSYLFIFDMKDL
jgi:hypothetical protein